MFNMMVSTYNKDEQRIPSHSFILLLKNIFIIIHSVHLYTLTRYLLSLPKQYISMILKIACDFCLFQRVYMI